MTDDFGFWMLAVAVVVGLVTTCNVEKVINHLEHDTECYDVCCEALVSE